MLVTNNFNTKKQEKINFGCSRTLAKEAKEVLFSHRRGFSTDSNINNLFDTFQRGLGDTIERVISESKPIEMVIPAFPFKMPTPKKTANIKADLAEETSMKYLKTILDELKQVYSQNHHIEIYSDGRPFAPIFNVKDSSVTEYISSLKELLNKNKLNEQIGVTSLENVYGNNFDKAREMLKSKMVDLETLRNTVLESEQAKSDLGGIRRYIRDILLDNSPELTTSKANKLAKPLGYEIMQTGNAWSALMKELSPETVRLSCHPKSAGSGMVGLNLSGYKDCYMTPWSGVGVKCKDGKVKIMYNAEVENNLAYIKKENNGVFYYEER